ncbi:hypothetical protein MIR68_011321 [Amoeboaphelidium protococcarum]|nr:hypothetical protein MIR68_011321 [Amoeboaphelidium protococcarum]
MRFPSNLDLESWFEQFKEFAFDLAFAESKSFHHKTVVREQYVSSAFIPQKYMSLMFSLTKIALKLIWIVVTLTCWPLIVAMWLLYNAECERPSVYYTRNSVRMKSILRRCQLLNRKYKPYFYTMLCNLSPLKYLVPDGWNMSGHLQTFLHEYLRIVPEVEFQRHLLATEDGGVIALDYYVRHSREFMFRFAEDSPVMIIIHGVTGGSHTQYVRHYVTLLAQNGIRPVVMNARGCGASELKTTKYFSCHYTDDIRQVVDHVHSQYPQAPLFATAYSLGANLLTKYLGEQGGDCKLTAAIAVANPFNWLVIDEWLQKDGINKHVYNFVLAKSLAKYLTQHKSVFQTCKSQDAPSTTASVESPKMSTATQNEYDIEEVLKCKTLQEYDERLTTKLWGYNTIREYYYEASGVNFMSSIKVPFLTVQALDDPIIPADAIPYQMFRKNPNLALVTTKVGGHIAWLENDPSGVNWSDKMSLEFTLSILDHVYASKIVMQRKQSVSSQSSSSSQRYEIHNEE